MQQISFEGHLTFNRPVMKKHPCFKLLIIGNALTVASLYTYIACLKYKISDFHIHAEVAEAMVYGGRIPPHPLYQLLLISAHNIFGVSYFGGTMIVIFSLVFISFLLVFKFLGDCKIATTAKLGAATVLFFSHPITIIYPYDQHLYYGYIASNAFHNPTILLLKCIALAHFNTFSGMLNHSDSSHRYSARLILLATLTVGSIIAKPNYGIAIVPATLLFMLIAKMKDSLDPEAARTCLLGVILPAILTLWVQYSFFYGEDNGSQIKISLFEVFLIHSDLWTLIPKLAGSFAFPISLYAVVRTRLMRQVDAQLSSYMLLVSLLFTFALVDTINGSGVGSGNFWWSAQISSFIVFFVCIRHYCRAFCNDQYVSLADRSMCIPGVFLTAHTVFGVLWYLKHCIQSFLQL